MPRRAPTMAVAASAGKSARCFTGSPARSRPVFESSSGARAAGTAASRLSDFGVSGARSESPGKLGSAETDSRSAGSEASSGDFAANASDSVCDGDRLSSCGCGRTKPGSAGVLESSCSSLAIVRTLIWRLCKGTHRLSQRVRQAQAHARQAASLIRQSPAPVPINWAKRQPQAQHSPSQMLAVCRPPLPGRPIREAMEVEFLVWPTSL